jgi:hypothetical protein
VIACVSRFRHHRCRCSMTTHRHRQSLKLFQQTITGTSRPRHDRRRVLRWPRPLLMLSAGQRSGDRDSVAGPAGARAGKRRTSGNMSCSQE